MNKVLMIALSMSLGACATTYERCTEVTDNPFEIENPRTATVRDLQVIYAEQGYKNQMSFQEFYGLVQAKTRVEWQRYGSIDQCIARKDASDQAIINNMAVGYEFGKSIHQDDLDDLRAQNAEAHRKPSQVNVYIQK